MQGFKTEQIGGSQIVVFEHVTETLAGGASIDPTAALAKFTSGIIPAGALISVKQVSGLHKPITITPGSPDTYDFVPLGFVIQDTKIEPITLVAVALAGVVRKDALPTDVKTGIDELIDNKLRKFTAV